MFRQKLPHWFWVVVETPISGGGVPDHHWCVNGVSGWNEYKAATGFVVGFRPEQIGWHASFARHGGRSFIIIRRKVRKIDELWIYRGVDAHHDMMKVFKPLVKMEGGPAAWQWQDVEKLLTT